MSYQETPADAKAGMLALDALEAYEASLTFDPGMMGILAGYIRLCAYAAQGAGYAKSDIVGAALAVVGSMIAEDPGADAQAIAEVISADVRDNVLLFQACPDGVIGTIN